MCVCCNRFSDAGSRVAWAEVLQNTVAYYHRMSCFAHTTGNSLVSTSSALRWFSSATLRRGMPVGGSITGSGSTLIPVSGGSFHLGSSSPIRSTLMNSNSLINTIQRNRMMYAGSSSASLTPHQGQSSSPTASQNRADSPTSSGKYFPHLFSSSGPSRGRLGSTESNGSNNMDNRSVGSLPSLPMFNTSPGLRQGKKYDPGHGNSYGLSGTPDASNNRLAPIVSKRTPPIFSVPFHSKDRRKSSDSSDSDN
jgi:hypothetical protein